VREHVQALGSGRVRGSEAWKEKALERQKPRRGSAAGSGQLVSARTDSQEDQGFEAGEAGGTRRPPPLGPRVTGKRVFGRVKREPIVDGGIRRLRASVGVEETGGDKDRETASLHTGG
jgi:hypothetical protein